uniref:STE/STE20/FRAY protein kinase n=1 Tax=Kwoniella pini CBS 10737 TaxID=1296096 RepID=A0A1B9HU97_9TREE|nr:STE/STE20/FRAY protein kinase [Kwoniella pini CBS 10737]OCF46846.1 STE/STE20/FRAY protein kinase [Kwoniella pini CBS 10737]
MTSSLSNQDSSRGMMKDECWGDFTSNFSQYELGPAIGFGASSTVYEAIFTPSQAIHSTDAYSTIVTPTTGGKIRPNLSITLPENNKVDIGERICAIKVSSSHPDVELLSKEIRLLGLCRHPNVLRILSTFTLPPDHQRICLVTPLIPGGSLAGILKWRSRLVTSPKHHRLPFRRGPKKRQDAEDEGNEQKGRLDEEEIKCIAKQVLDGLGYLHQNGFLHRDIKAGNLLIDEDGTILLADFGVGFVGGDDLRKRKSFVGTPNWMAPEVVSGQKYDQKADIWSLGITLLELAHGTVPGARYQTSKALSHIISDPSPTLDRSLGGFSRSMKEFIDICLYKDPALRPTAQMLMEHHWLRNAKKPSFLAQSLLTEVPPLTQRQELRRVPTMSSLLSHTSSWDFPNTPNPSLPSSPVKSVLGIPSARSPSIASHLEYFSSVGRTHSRNSSFSIQPPSPRISLKQWADDTYAYNHNLNSSLSLSLRAGGSERGRKRNSLMASDLLRRGKSVNFDNSKINQVKASNSLEVIPQSTVVTQESHEEKKESLNGQSTLGLMSPVMEITRSKNSNVEHLDLNGLGISNARRTILEGGHTSRSAEAQNQDITTGQTQMNVSALSESPEDVFDLGRPIEITPVIRHQKIMGVEQENVADESQLRKPKIQEGRTIDVAIRDGTANMKQSLVDENVNTSLERTNLLDGTEEDEVDITKENATHNRKSDNDRKIWSMNGKNTLKRIDSKNSNKNDVTLKDPVKSHHWHGVLSRVTSKMHKR